MPLSKDSITKALADVRSKTEKRKFTQAIELSVKLRELDLKKPEARINENLELPTAADKDSKVAVIAGGDLAVRAKNAGADIIIGREDLDKLGRAKKEARKIAQMKRTDSYARTLKSAVKEVAGACVSMGVTVDAKEPKEFIKNLDAGQYDAALKELQ